MGIRSVRQTRGYYIALWRFNTSTERDIMVKLTGNRCGHDPEKPIYTVFPATHKKRPDILEKAKTRLEAFFFKPLDYLKDLNTLNNSERQKRSERREAIKAVGEVLCQYTCLATLRVGWYSSDQAVFRPLSLKEIAEKACIDIGRAKRALGDMAKVGYLRIQRQFTKDANGDYVGLISIRELTIKFFIHLGFAQATLELRRHWKLKKIAIEAAKRNPRTQKLLDRVRGMAGKKTAQAPYMAAQTDIERKVDEGAQEIMRLKALHPKKTWLQLANMLAKKNQADP